MPYIGWPGLAFFCAAIALWVCVAVWAGHEKARELEAMLGRPPAPGQPVYKPQGNGPRLLAFIIDFIIYVVAVWLVGGSTAGALNTSRPGLGLVLAVVVVVWFAYFAGLEALRGRTVGKMALHLRVIDANGRCGWRQAFARNTTKFFAVGTLVGCIISAIYISRSPSAQRLGDRWAGTTVVKDMTPVTADEPSLKRALKA
jgi:uncharacterized RDD family membrane protein YckC